MSNWLVRLYRLGPRFNYTYVRVRSFVGLTNIIFFHHGHGCFYMSNWLVRLDRFRVRSFVGVTNVRTDVRTDKIFTAPPMTNL